jgi:hypothetical protein
MAFLLQFHEVAVVPYLLDLDLSREGRIILYAALQRELGTYGDTFMNEPDRRLAPGSDCFRVDLLFRDPVQDVIHLLRLIVSDAAAPYGILRIVYVEDVAGPPAT